MKANKLTFKISAQIAIMVLMLLSAKAQTYTGCVLYTPLGTPVLTSPIYTGNPGVSLPVCSGYSAAIYSSTSATPPLNTFCYSPAIPSASPAAFRNCAVVTIIGGSGVYQCGIVRTIMACPIDDYIGYLLLSLSVVGIFFVRNRQERIAL